MALRRIALGIVAILAFGCQATVEPSATPLLSVSMPASSTTAAPDRPSPSPVSTLAATPALVIHHLVAGQSAESMIRGRLTALTGALCLRQAFVEPDPDLLGKKLESLAAPADRPDGLLADPRFYLGADIDAAVAALGATEAWVGSATGAWILRHGSGSGTGDGLIGIQVLQRKLKDGRTVYGWIGDSVTACPSPTPMPS